MRAKVPQRRTAAALAVISALTVSPIAAQEPALDIVAPATRDVTPPGITPGPAGAGPLVREPRQPAAPEPPRWRRFFLPKTTDAATLRVENRTIRIAGVSARAPEARCRNADGVDWPCGRTALHSLRMFLRGRAVECFYPYADTAVEITAPCRVGRTDLGLWLLSQGWAEPAEHATDEYRQAAADARCARRGLWRAGRADTSCPGVAQR